MPQGRRAKEAQGKTAAPAACTHTVCLRSLQSACSSCRCRAPPEAAPLFAMPTEVEEVDAAGNALHWRQHLMKTIETGVPTLEEIRRLVNDAAQRTDHPDMRRASRAFGQQSAGRTAKNDRVAITEVESMLLNSCSRSEWAVLLDAAQKFCPSEKPRSAAERLRRKLRKKTSTK